MKRQNNKDLEKEISELDRVGFDTKGETERSGSFLIVDDKEEDWESREDSLVVLPISFAVKEYPWAGDLLFSLVDKDQDEWTKAVAGSKQLLGSFIYLKEGMKIESPVQTCFFLHNEGKTQVLHNIIVLEPNSELAIITGCATGNLVSLGRHIAVTETFIREGATLSFTMIHDWGAETVVYPRAAIKIGKNGSYTSNYIALTQVKKIQSNPIAYLSDGATAKFNSIIYGRPGSLIDMGARTILNGRDSSSEIISRIVSKNSRIISKAYIEGSNRGTKGHTECNGLLLDAKSSVYAIPELEAKNIDTELSHEASIGKIAGEQLNYLMSRGLDEDSAKSLLIRGFLEKGIRGLPKKLQNRLNKIIEKATEKKSI
ncbi:MAG: SufD family Fe-S cluster assembly protein [candidate division WOR-3 bacterium]|nr:SufD family Fe-S cluster assembly protein [candidate division WOR-3 bacterium]